MAGGMWTGSNGRAAQSSMASCGSQGRLPRGHMEQEPDLKRSRSGDSCEHRHRNGMGYEDPACIEVRS